MKRSLMLAASVAAFVLPAAAPVEAQDSPLFRSREDVRAAARAEAAATATVSAPAQQRQEPRRERRQRSQSGSSGGSEQPAFRSRQDVRDARAAEDRGQRREERRDRGAGAQTPTDPNQPLFRNRQDVLDARRADDRRIRREERQEERRQDRPENREERREWRQDRRDDRQDRRDDRRERREDRREYREYRQRFNADMWRQQWQRQRGYDWWRNDRRFRGYSGVRVGFYFAPGYGYYSVPRNYWGQRYYEGQYLPSIFWRYSLNDWRTYGLGYPPPGTRWVLVDNSIYLIDEYDGYIIDVIRDAWRW